MQIFEALAPHVNVTSATRPERPTHTQIVAIEHSQ